MTLPPLPEFTPDPRCPKCCGRHVDTTWRPSFHEAVASDPLIGFFAPGQVQAILAGDYGPECLVRTCNGCGYVWLEQTADTTAG